MTCAQYITLRVPGSRMEKKSNRINATPVNSRMRLTVNNA